ncbi:MAG: PGF-pre-PGF domain-containing protein [Candidatus Methanoperedens sp.]|nr:PGF-pre-PGF domain-containing protein [Candidatus Methanoperedens sp.]
MSKESIKYIAPLVLALLIFGMMAGSASAALNVTISSAKITAPNNITIVFVPSDTGNRIVQADFNAFAALNLTSGGPRNLVSNGSFIPANPTTVNFTFDGAPVAPNETATINVTHLGDIQDNDGKPLDPSANPIQITDGQAPGLTRVSIASNNTNTSLANVGNNVTINFTSNESIATPTVTIDGNPADSVFNTSNNWTATRLMNGSEPRGLVTFTIDFSDLAGNSGTQVTATNDGSFVIFATGPLMTALPTGYGSMCGGYASDTCPYFTLNVMVTDIGSGVNYTNVTVNVSTWNNTGFLLMNPNGTAGPNHNFSLNVTDDKIVRGTFNATVTAYDNFSVSNTTNLSVEAHRQVGLDVVGYNSSKNYPAYPTFVSMFYNNSPVVIIVNTTDSTLTYTNITVDFAAVDGNTTLVWNSTGAPIGDGNKTYRLTHTLGTILPGNDAKTAWVNATVSIPGGGTFIIPLMAFLVVVPNMNPINMGMGLGGDTTNWTNIPDYSNAYLTFEAVNGTSKVATLKFNEPINLTNYTTALNLRYLEEKLMIAGTSINLSGAADALIGFNKSANLTIYNLTSFTTSPAIFADGVLIASPGQSSGGAASNISWNQTNHALTLNVSHWTSYSWGTFGINLTNTSVLSVTTNAPTNATYTFILQNNGTLADTYNLTIDNPNNAIAALTPGNITLAPNGTQVYSLNVTSGANGIFKVNVTATSFNFSNRTASINTTTTVTGATNGTNLAAISVLQKTTHAGTNATYTLRLKNNGTSTDTYTINVINSTRASTAALNISSPWMLDAGQSVIFTLNVTNVSSGIFQVNVTANSTNDPGKVGYINTTTTVPIVITITNPANNSVNDTGFVNVTAILDANGTAILNWNGVNNTMMPNTSQPAGTIFSMNMTDLLSGNHSFKVYANDSNVVFNVSETRIVTVNRTIINNTIGTIINSTTFITNATLNITAPDGNVTVTIPDGTNASIGGVALTSISIDSLAQVNSTFTLGGSDRWIGENLSLGPEGARFRPDIQIRFNYTDDEWRAAGITDESQLRVQFYNTSAIPNAWETPAQVQNQALNYIIVNVSHFSTFGLVGTTSSGGNNGGNNGGSSGTGGGGGVVTGEDFANIAKSESNDEDLIANTPVTYTFKTPELGVYEIAMTGKENEPGITVRAEVLKGTSKQVTAEAPGTVYKNINILAGTQRMKEALVKFRVENSWLGTNSLAAGDVKLLHWDGSKWNQLDTTQTTTDTTYTYYEAKTTALSPFAISGITGSMVTSTATPAGAVTGTSGTPTGTGTPAPKATSKTPGFELGLTVAILSVAYLFGRKRR